MDSTENTSGSGADETASQQDLVRKKLTSIKNRIRVTKVTATRSVKSPRGDHFVGFSAQYDTCLLYTSPSPRD